MNRAIPAILSLAAFLCTPCGAAPQPRATQAQLEPLSLTEAQNLALQNHPSLSAQGFRAQAAGESVKETESALYPQLYGSANRVFAGSNTRVTAAPGALNNPTVLAHGSAGLTLTQLITDFGRQSDLVAASELALQSEQDRVASVHDAVLFRATAAYYDVLRAEALLKVAQGTLKSRSTLNEQVSQLRSAKLKSDLDVSFAKLGVDQANLLQIRAEAAIDDAWARLAEALGLDSVKHFALSTGLPATLPPLDARETATELALAHNPEIQALEASRDSAHKQADADAKAGYPTISAGGFVGANPYRQADQHLSSSYAAGGIVLTIPLYTGGRLTAQERRSSLTARAADRDVDAARNGLVRDVQIAWDSANTAYRNIAVTDQLLASSAQALDLTKARYDIGSSSIVDVAQAEVAALEAEIAQSNAKYDYLTERAFLAYREGGNAIGAADGE
jgi:outer membrane protein